MNSIENAPSAGNDRMEGLSQRGEENKLTDAAVNQTEENAHEEATLPTEEQPAVQETFFANMREAGEAATQHPDRQLPVDAVAHEVSEKMESLISSNPDATTIDEPVAATIQETDMSAQPEIPGVEEHESHPDDLSDESAATESFSHLNRKELLQKLQELSKSEDILSVKKSIREIRDCFIALTREEQQAALTKARMSEEEEEEEEKSPIMLPPDPFHDEFSLLMRSFNQRVNDLQKTREKEQAANLRVKKDIIEEIRQLADSPEMNFRQIEKLHELQSRWRATGMVPAGESNNLWEDYRFNTGRFYERLKIDKELRELDQKKNQVTKSTLCDKAEELILEPSIQTSMQKARELQQAWKEVGPVSKEVSESLWQRFSSAIDKVYQRQRELVESLREAHAKATEAKEALIAEMKTLATHSPSSHKEWLELSNASEQMMEKWKQAGFASKEKNEELWKSFKQHRDEFYKSREKFYTELRQALNHNLKLKQDICEQVEKLVDSNDWKSTANTIKQLQEQWKTIGPVSKKHSDKVWGRFRKACDTFFENKKLHFADEVEQQSKNLEMKMELLKKIEEFVLLDNNNDTIAELKKFQNEWMGIGHVPFKEKESLNTRYRKAIDKKFEEVRSRVGDHHRSLFTMKYQSIKNEQRGTEKLNDEKSRIREKIGRLNQEILQAENNMGFFAKSANADSILKDARTKVENTRKEIQRLKEQLKLIDQTQHGVGEKKESDTTAAADIPAPGND